MNDLVTGNITFPSRMFSFFDDMNFAKIPRADVIETNSQYIVHIDLPGIKKEDVTISVLNGIVSVTAKNKIEKVKDGEYVVSERSRETITRTFQIDPDVDSSAITAELKNGVLTITIPKLEKAKIKQIQIK